MIEEPEMVMVEEPFGRVGVLEEAVELSTWELEPPARAASPGGATVVP